MEVWPQSQQVAEQKGFQAIRITSLWEDTEILKITNVRPCLAQLQPLACRQLHSRKISHCSAPKELDRSWVSGQLAELQLFYERLWSRVRLNLGILPR